MNNEAIMNSAGKYFFTVFAKFKFTAGDLLELKSEQRLSNFEDAFHFPFGNMVFARVCFHSKRAIFGFTGTRSFAHQSLDKQDVIKTTHLLNQTVQRLGSGDDILLKRWFLNFKRCL